VELCLSSRSAPHSEYRNKAFTSHGSSWSLRVDVIGVTLVTRLGPGLLRRFRDFAFRFVELSFQGPSGAAPSRRPPTNSRTPRPLASSPVSPHRCGLPGDSTRSCGFASSRRLLRHSASLAHSARFRRLAQAPRRTGRRFLLPPYPLGQLFFLRATLFFSGPTSCPAEPLRFAKGRRVGRVVLQFDALVNSIFVVAQDRPFRCGFSG
jgi:hypothetical protein